MKCEIFTEEKNPFIHLVLSKSVSKFKNQNLS